MNMNCEICRDEMDDYLSGDLDRAASARVRTHLESCPECSMALDELERENRLYAEFFDQTAVEPAPASWTAIRDRIRQESVKPSVFSALMAWLTRPVVLQQAAFAVVLVVISVATTLYFVRRTDERPPIVADLAVDKKPQPEKVAVEPTPTATPEIVPAPRRNEKRARPVSEKDLLAAQVERAEKEYLSAIRLLDRAIARRRDEIDPDVMRHYEASLALIDQSIESSRTAFRENRNDLNASNFLIAAYSRKVELMQDIAMR